MHYETGTQEVDSHQDMTVTVRQDVEVKVEPIRLKIKQDQNG
jgi:hypothetical protein